MATDIKALQSALNLIADAAHDYITSKENGSTSNFATYENLLPDVLALVPQIGEIPTEVKALTVEDGLILVNGLMARVAISDVHAEAVISASLKILNDVISVLVPDIKALSDAIKASKEQKV